MEPEESKAIKEAREYGIDISLLMENIKLTPLQRLRKHQDIAEFMEKVRNAGRKNHDPK